jgi:hypothetical protein
MGKLMEFDPSKRRKKKEDGKKPEANELKENPKLHEEALSNFFGSLQKFSDNIGENDPAGLMMELMMSGTMVHERIEEIRRNTEGFSQNILSEREESARKLTNSKLIEAFRDSNSSQWHKNPAYYRAVVNEILERLKMITKEDK